MSIAGSQRQILLALLARLQPHWHRDRNLPARLDPLLKGDRRFGSRDRRLYRELIYTALRLLPEVEPLLADNPDEAVRRLAWAAAETPATRNFRAAFATGETYAADPVRLLPGWFRAHCPAAFEPLQAAALATRAPLWLRLQTDDASAVIAEFAALGWTVESAPLLPSALRLGADVDVTKTAAYARGAIEVQDLGSQFLLQTVGIEPGGMWLDACAGAGGKTLQLARLLGPSGRVDATDVRSAALDELVVRVRRAGLANIRRVDAPAATYDGVLIDAPCSGSGTWRRAPHLKWSTTPDTIERARTVQLALLHQHAAHVRPGGRLIYTTCSLSHRENDDVVSEFLVSAPEFTAAPFARDFGGTPTATGLTILPATHDSDGFFVASLQRH
ncbi:RsmB/NOP family class I SAM-dependent RNA methyltransferase [Horticoccus luteus]|uniref:RsmB/NOP family class I SAM-dependent RNA methyltransferase n=1 Tax=Horticoccus luteus TaxID=2862869 RepID=A0A8F9TZJ2_9BACT|nr:RsmB/NOP family class I SAM-dependent RNA methyltransferase [Horticoccus luteus]QYM80628.1 RsmB/NOP family class I SAM-dependent RNA methyltransferase [Horticoccus luteus]